MYVLLKEDEQIWTFFVTHNYCITWHLFIILLPVHFLSCPYVCVISICDKSLFRLAISYLKLITNNYSQTNEQSTNGNNIVATNSCFK